MNLPELFFHEIFHLKDPLVGLLAFFYFGTEHGGGRFKKITLYFSCITIGTINIFMTPKLHVT